MQQRTAHTVGKVILIDHSMGGLATRYAAAQTVDGRPVWDEIGLVVTLGTPNLGSGWANAADPVVALVCNNIGLVAWRRAVPARTIRRCRG